MSTLRAHKWKQSDAQMKIRTGDRLRALRYSVLGQLTRKDQSDSGLNLP